eukprot:225084-Pleurochrysis_carterae.AAC.1
MLCLSWLALAVPRVPPSPTSPGSPDCETRCLAPARFSGVASLRRLCLCEAAGRRRSDAWDGLFRWR